jgi:hypothetical protein
LYREIAPPPDLAPFVECFWTSEVKSDGCQRILPDGCLDLLFFSRGNQLVDAQVIGAMTRFQDVRLCARESLLGVRFHPGMAGACLRCDIPSLNDRATRSQSSFAHGATCPSPVSPMRRASETGNCDGPVTGIRGSRPSCFPGFFASATHRTCCIKV